MSMNMQDPEREHELRQPRPDQVGHDEPLGQPRDPDDLHHDPQHPVDGERPVGDSGNTEAPSADPLIDDPSRARGDHAEDVM